MKGPEPMSHESNQDARFDQLLNEMRDESAAPETVAAAQTRVWEKLAHASGDVCPTFRADFDAYIADSLSDSRRLLMDDHLSRCAACRRSLAERRGDAKVVAMPAQAAPVRRSVPQWSKWAVAAGLAAVMLYAGRERIDSALAPSGPRATVEQVSGTLYTLTGGAAAKGALLTEGEVVRTGPGSRAVLRLADGSAVEMNERTELYVHASWSGQSVYLDRGDVVVQAAKQRRGHLRVLTPDATASVKGTIFAVSAGTAGSLVTVVEGAVEVDRPGKSSMLHRGDQAATHPSLAAVPVRDALAWSESASRYYEILGVLVQVEKELAASGPGLRTSSALLAKLPAQPVLYGAIPNIGGSVGRAVTLIEQRAQGNASLKQWWDSASAAELKTILNQVQTISTMLGDEIAFVLAKKPDGNVAPLVLAAVKPGQEDALAQQIQTLIHQQTGAALPYRVAGGLLAVSHSAADLATLTSQFGAGAGGEFAAELQRRYQRGVGWLFAFDTASMNWGDAVVAESTGFARMKHVFFEQRTTGGTDENEASVMFHGARIGITSWLAAPASAGSAEYVSADAIAAVSASTRNPKESFDELLSQLSRVAPKMVDEFRAFETKTGVNVGNDIASALGTDFTLALERATLPLPGWAGIIEVYQPSSIDTAVRHFVDGFNAQLSPDQLSAQKLTLIEEEVQGRRWLGLKSAAAQVTFWWTYDRGYMVASTDRAVAAQAIATRSGGFPLIRSTSFQQQIPGGAGLHSSGFVWVNTKGALTDFAAMAPEGAIRTLLENRDPILIVLNGETERISAVSRTRLTSLVLDAMLAAGAGQSGAPATKVSMAGKQANAVSH